MSFLGIVAQAKTFLEQNGRVSLSALKLEFDLDDARLESLVEELVDVQQVAAREGKVLSWIGSATALPTAEAEAAPTTPSEATGARSPAEAERRQLTVMFVDLLDSTELSQRLDAEDLREVVRAYQESACSLIERYEGHVAQYLGDGLLVYFGYPQAHEDDAERAVRAGLEVLAALGSLNEVLEPEHGVRLAARVGIHTGPVVVGEMGGGARRETLALGGTPNIAARLEAVAEPGTVVMSDATLRLVAGLFVTEDRRVPALKGIEGPIRMHKVVQPSGIRSRLGRATRLTPFVGREQELGLLLDRFEQAQEGQGQAVLVAGEAGIGKSRLVHRLRERLQETPHTWLECRTSPYTQSSGLHPIIEMVEGALDFKKEDTAEEKLGRLERGLAHVGLEPDEAVPLFASLLSLRPPERYAPLEISPELQREKTLETLLAWVLALGERQPLMLVMEDLHWIDPSTLEWLGLLIEECPTQNVLLLMTHRPDFEPSWPGREHLHAITLSRLSRRQSQDLVARAIAEAVLPAELIERIASRSDGVPLFVEELAKGIVEAGHTDSQDIPETLQDSLMARLDRLGEAKEVAQLDAAIGREFEYPLLEAVAPLKDRELRDELGRLVEAELVYRRGHPPKATYTFKHALVQDTAYQSLLESQRRELHRRIADTLEKEFRERVVAEPELVAHHYDRAGRAEKAVSYYQRAGDEARARSSNLEAIAHLERGVELTQALPEGPERDERELVLHLSLGPTQIAAHGLGSEQAGRAWERARVLCEAVGNPSQLASALRGLTVFHQTRSDLDAAIELGEQLLALGRSTGDDAQVLPGHVTLGISGFGQARFRECLKDFDSAVTIYEPDRHAPLALTYGIDQAVAAHSYSSWALWFLGYPDGAAARAEETIEHARAMAHPYSLVLGLCWAAVLYMYRRDWERCARCASECIELSERQGFPLWLGVSKITRALALACGRGEDTLTEVTEGLAGAASTKARAGTPALLWRLARIHQEMGREADALGVVEIALATSVRQKEPFFDAELLRLKGDLMRAKDAAEAQRLFHQALEIARGQEAKSLELRAATSLARLWQREGKTAQARELLQPVYDWFTEGFDTQDLKDAKTLLEELKA